MSAPDLPLPARRCSTCACPLPVCAGQVARGFCEPGLDAQRLARSQYESSLRGWPAASSYAGPFADDPPPPRRMIDRSKPNLPLGVRAGSPDCAPCVAASR